ncbi:MAG: NAD(P)H-hydrate dehydratase [Rhodoferax sp.]
MAQPWPLYDTLALRALEQRSAAALPAHTLMQRAGRASARLALALAPHAQRYWIACGPGNNGGDGLEAAIHLRAWGKDVWVSLLPHATAPADARQALQRAQDAGVSIHPHSPEHFDACIDALLGLGTQRPLQDTLAAWVQRINQAPVPVLALDLPTGLDADSGRAQALCVHASATLTLLGLKPGLFTAQGRDACGDIWLDTLGTVADPAQACAELNPAPPRQPRAHDSHKGSYGDVCVLGGAPGMAGAAVLAARAALHGGAGRVYLALLDPQAPAWDPQQPELMLRRPDAMDWDHATVVAGCGGGAGAIAAWLPMLLAQAPRLVLDADALNALAADPALQGLLRARAPHSTVLTPHPLEAARLLGNSAAQVQAQRLHAAQNLAERCACTVVLKGSGSVIAAPGQTPRINPTGNARLATAGSGDVLAGLVAAYWARCAAAPGGAWAATCAAVYQHGAAAQGPDLPGALSAGMLAQRVAAL